MAIFTVNPDKEEAENNKFSRPLKNLPIILKIYIKTKLNSLKM